MASGLENIETIESPFRRFVTTIGVFPTAFTDAMTYYECLAYLVKYLEETVIPAVNENAEALEELQTLYVQLKSYVDNYFANLDVQEEINNKLDQMAEDGTLQEIITTYIQANVAWTFDTVADMKEATNLVDGSYARTLGFHTLNDGGGSLYLIKNTGTANEKDIIAVGDLKAHLVLDGVKVKVEQLGALGDGETDDTAIINYALTNYSYIIMSKNYVISDSLALNSNSIIDGEGLGKIFRTPEETTLDYTIGYIFVLQNKDNVTIKNLALESQNGYTTTARPDHPNWNNSLSSNICTFSLSNGCSNITITNVSTKYMYNEFTANSNSDNGLNTNIVIKDYKADETTSTSFYFGWCENVLVENLTSTPSDLPLPGAHFIYVGHNGGNKINIINTKFYGNHYHVAALNFGYADFIIGDTTPNNFDVKCINCHIEASSCIRFRNNEIKCVCENCEFINQGRYNQGNYPTLNWTGSIISADVNKGNYIFNDCQFTTTASTVTDTDALITYESSSYSSYLDTSIEFNNCHVDNIRYFMPYNSFDRFVTVNNSYLEIAQRIYQQVKYGEKLTLNNCIAKTVSNYLISSAGTASIKYVLKDNYIITTSTNAVINSDNANGHVELYNNVIETQKVSDFIGGSQTANVFTNNTLVNKAVLSI